MQIDLMMLNDLKGGGVLEGIAAFKQKQQQ